MEEQEKLKDKAEQFRRRETLLKEIDMKLQRLGVEKVEEGRSAILKEV